jgi:hypothetical protein
VEEFNEKLLQAIDETISYCLGSSNANLIYEFLEKKGCTKCEIPEKLDVLVDTLEKLVGVGRGQMMGAVPIIENMILKIFCKKMGINYEKIGVGYLPSQIEKLKESCNSSAYPR